MDKDNLYTLVSFNCRSVKRSVDHIRQLCHTSDIIALQETWLLPSDLHFLSDIDPDYGYVGTSAVDTSTGMLVGRPYGGVAILWKKSVLQNVSIVQCDNARVCAIKVELGQKSFLVFSIYMPTDCVVNLPEFTDCLSLVSAIINSEHIESAYLLGDFNAHPGQLFFNELKDFCAESEWICADVELLGLSADTYSFISDANGSRRWLDHCLATESAKQTIVKVEIKYDVLWSDHFPLVIYCDLDNIKAKLPLNNIEQCNKVRWGERKTEQIALYNQLCNEQLKLIDFPSKLSGCCDFSCDDVEHTVIIDKMYDEIVDILTRAAEDSYCYSNKLRKKKPVVGWNRHVSDAHREARSKFQLWMWCGKPRSGRVWSEMQESRKIFKSRLKWCQNNSDQLKMDILATQHAKHDFRSFWKSTQKVNSRPGLPVSVGGITDPTDIAEMFKGHFTVNSPLGPSRSRLEGVTRGQELSVRFTAKDVRRVITSMTRGKSPGHDDLSIEHLKYAGVHIPRVLAMFYSLCLGHSYLPPAMMRTVVVPIIKSKTGDISDANNYRPISLATVLSKVLDSLLNSLMSRCLQIHDNQFGFKSGLSTETAILCLKQTVKYYTDRKTPVYACFLDLSRAFDLVSYDILWDKLSVTSLPSECIRILRYWYGNQVNVVRWSGTLSEPYRLECGVRQGGLTSPTLFNLYVNALIERLSSTHVGCHVGGVCVNNISYADDMVLLSASVCGLSKLLGICEQYALSHGLLYNTKKSECMVFRAGGKCPDSIPSIKLNSVPLKRVDTFKYLGHLVTSDLKDDTDIERERRALSVRANMIARRFARCSKEVKNTLFRAYCTCFYSSALWANYTQKQYSALRIQYNNAYRVLLGLSRHCSASGMFAESRIDCFYATMRKRCASLVRRVRASSNTILRMMAERFDCHYINHCCMVNVVTV